MASFKVHNKNGNEELANQAKVIDIAKKMLIENYDEDTEIMAEIDLGKAISIIEKYDGKVVPLPIRESN